MATSEKTEYKPVPVLVAKQIAFHYDKSMIVIFAYDSAYERQHVTTYGISAWEKEQAAAVGEFLARQIDCDLSKQIKYEDFHRNYDAAKSRERLEVLQAVDRFLTELLITPELFSKGTISLLRESVRAAIEPPEESPCTA